MLSRCLSCPGSLKASSDVYSFGVFLLELLSGRSITRDETFQDIFHLIGEINELDINTILDPRIAKEACIPEAKAFAVLARHAMQQLRDARPTMEDVVGVLEKAMSVGEKFKEQQSLQMKTALSS